MSTREGTYISAVDMAVANRNRAFARLKAEALGPIESAAARREIDQRFNEAVAAAMREYNKRLH